MESKFLDIFKKYAEKKKGKLFGEILVVEILKEEEKKSKGGIIIAESKHVRSDYTMLKSTIGIVLEVGEGYYDPDTGADVPLQRKPGEVLWVSDGNLRYVTTFPGLDAAVPEKTIAVISENHIYKAWENIEAYKADQEILNEEA